MILESKIKKAAILVALDLHLKRMNKSPERCARNLLELGTTAYPEKLNRNELELLQGKLLEICKNNNAKEARDLFIEAFEVKPMK